MPSSATIPLAWARRVNQVLRPRDAAEFYAHPRAELKRLTDLGVARRLATGYYALVPRHRMGDTRWVPDIGAAALAIAQADYGPTSVCLVGVSAARHHGAIPRALAIAVVAVPKQRPELTTDLGRIVFTARDATRLDLQRVTTELTEGLVTTPEQTLLDIAARPNHGGLTADTARSAAALLAGKADLVQVAALAEGQHVPAAMRRVREWLGGARA